MKLFVPPPRADRAPGSLADSSSDTFGSGMDVALTIGLFVVIGVLLDAWLGTAPVITVVLLLVAAVGQFARLKYLYDAEMDRHEAERRASQASQRSVPQSRTEGSS
jgi:hypothetical protein